MKRFGVARTQGKGADIFWINRLPANRDLWFLRIIPAVRCRLRWEGAGSEHRGGILAVPFLALGKVNLEAIESGKVPGRTSKWYPHFLVDRPNIPVDSGASAIVGADALKGCIQGVTIARPSRRVILTANREGDRPGRKIEEVAVVGEIAYRQLVFARVMQVDVNSAPGRLGVVGIEIQERIKCSSWIRIQKSVPQSRLTYFADGQILPLIPRITKT